MPQINTPAIRHLGPVPHAGWQWLPFADSTYRICMMHALNVVSARVRGPTRCSAARRLLPGGRSFAAIWDDPAIWISYDPGNFAGRFGASVGDEITVSQYACRMGLRAVAATLIHELLRADCDDAIPHDAEQTLLRCLLERHYDPVLTERLLHQPRVVAGADVGEVVARNPTLVGWS